MGWRTFRIGLLTKKERVYPHFLIKFTAPHFRTTFVVGCREGREWQVIKNDICF